MTLETVQAEPITPDEPTEAEITGCARSIVEILETVVLAFLLFLGLNALTLRIVVDGSSMEPSLHDKSMVLVNRLAYRFGSLQRGDVIVFQRPAEPGIDYVKRIIGLPGDEVRIQNSQVMINGQVIAEPYIAEAPAYSGSWIVPADSYFVLGDNRNQSSDSHFWNNDRFVHKKNIAGKAIVVYWPFPSVRIIEHERYSNVPTP